MDGIKYNKLDKTGLMQSFGFLVEARTFDSLEADLLPQVY